MRRMTLIALAGLLLFFVGAEGAPYANSAAIFELGSSGRALGMGGAFLALADDESAAFYNPAGLGFLHGIGLSSLYARQFDALNYAAIGFTLPYFGVTVLQLDSGWIETAESGFRYTSRAGIFSAGFSIGPIGLGGRFKLYRVAEPYSASGWAFDPALLIVTDIVRIGLLLENGYAQAIEFSDGHTEAWERRVRLGIATTIVPSEGVHLNAVVEGAGLFSTHPQFCTGLEAEIGALAARFGYDGAGVTFGLAIRFASFQVDLAYATQEILPDSYRLSLTYRF